MLDALSFLSFPFMQRALLTGVVLAFVLAALGVFVTLRKMAFFGEGVAHASLAGIAIAILAGLTPLPIAILWAVFVALGIFLLEKHTKLPSDTLIGIFFTASMAAGVLMMSFTQGYQPELISFLFGSILAVTSIDLIIIVTLGLLIGFWTIKNQHDLTLMSLSEEVAEVKGIAVERKTLAFYIALAIATVLGVKILGIILVSALLIIPAATSRMLAYSFRSHFIQSIIISEITFIAGLITSYYLDTPSGATIVLFGSLIFFILLPFQKR